MNSVSGCRVPEHLHLTPWLVPLVISFRMRYVAAYLLAALGGNEKPEAKDIKKILESVGIEADDTRLTKVQGSCCCRDDYNSR